MENILTTSDTQINSSTESQIINMDEINNVLDCFLYSGWDLDYFYNYFEIFYDNFFNVPLHRLPDKISEATYNLLCYFFCITKHPFNDIHIENDYFDFSEFVELYVDCILNLSHSKKEILRNENGMPIGITWFKDNDSDNPYIISHCSSYFEMNTYRFVKSLNTDCIYLDPETQNENCFSDNTKINVITAKKMFKNIFKNMTHEKIQPIFSFVNKKANEFNYLLNHKNLAIKSNYYYKICEFYNNSSYFKKIEDYIKESNYQDEIKKYNEILLFMYYFINLEEKITPHLNTIKYLLMLLLNISK